MRIPLIFLTLLGAAAALAQTSRFSERNPRYVLQPSDVLEIHYRYTPEFDQTVTVQPDGFVALQIVGDLKLQGLTVDQLKTTILEKASQRLNNPEVTIVLKDFEKPYFVVGGEVGAPGRFEMRGEVTALQAIQMAGGFKTASAKHSQVLLFRRVGPDLAETKILNLKTAMAVSAKEPLADLHSGDMLIVPQNRSKQDRTFHQMGKLGRVLEPARPVESLIRLTTMFRSVKPLAARVYAFLNAGVVLLVLVGVFVGLNWDQVTGGIGPFLAIRVTLKNVIVIGLFLLSWTIAFRTFGLSKPSPSEPLWRTLLQVTKACTVASVFALLFPLTTQTGAFTHRIVLYFLPAAILATLCGQLAAHAFGGRLARSLSGRRDLIIVGSGPRAWASYERFQEPDLVHTRVLGFVDSPNGHKVTAAIRARCSAPWRISKES